MQGAPNARFKRPPPLDRPHIHLKSSFQPSDMRCELHFLLRRARIQRRPLYLQRHPTRIVWAGAHERISTDRFCKRARLSIPECTVELDANLTERAETQQQTKNEGSRASRDAGG